MISRRLLSVNFSQLGADDDLVYRNELIDLMIENLEELEQGYYESLLKKDKVFLEKAFHKVKTTLVVLDDKELNGVVEDLKDDKVAPAAISHYKRIKAEITTSLLAEKP